MTELLWLIGWLLLIVVAVYVGACLTVGRWFPLK